MRLWQRRTCATFTVVVTPSITTISWLNPELVGLARRKRQRHIRARRLARVLTCPKPGRSDEPRHSRPHSRAHKLLEDPNERQPLSRVNLPSFSKSNRSSRSRQRPDFQLGLDYRADNGTLFACDRMTFRTTFREHANRGRSPLIVIFREKNTPRRILAIVSRNQHLGLGPLRDQEAWVDPYPRGPDWMPITPKTGSLFHAESQSGPRSELHGAVQRLIAKKGGA